MSSNSVELKLEGMDQVFRQIDQLSNDLKQKLEKEAVKAGLEPIEDEAVRLAPVGMTGNLANSIKTQVRRVNGGLYGRVIAKAPHSHLVEYGFWWTKKLKSGWKKRYFYVGDPSGIGPRPFMRPAIEAKADQAVEAVTNKVREFFK